MEIPAWLTRFGHFLTGEAPETPILIVATPLLKDMPPAVPLTIVAQSKDVTSALKQIAKIQQGKGEQRAVKAKPKHKGKR